MEKMGKASVVPKEMAVLRLLQQKGPLTKDQILTAFNHVPKAVKFNVEIDELKASLTALHKDLYIQRRFTDETSPPLFEITGQGESVLGPLAERDYTEVARDLFDDPEVILGRDPFEHDPILRTPETR